MTRDERRTSVALASLLFHGGLALAVLAIEAPPPPSKVVRITMREAAPPPEPAKPEPEPEPEPEAPADAEPEPPPSAVEAPPPEPEPAPPRPRRAPPTPKASDPKAAPEAPEFGVTMVGGVGPGGLAVPVGDPGGAPRGGHAQPVRKVRRERPLKAEPPSKEADTCSEAAQKPRPTAMPQPEYSERARAAGIEGVVRVRLTVDASGVVTGAELVQGLDPDLDAAALSAVRKATFTPAARCGAPVSATFTISVRFSL
ncbi:MAG: TonB family protein [Nannocystaceae bacterium]